MTDGDPLEIEARMMELVERRCFIVDGDRLFQRSLARIAHAAPNYHGEPPLTEFLHGRIDQAIRDLIEEDFEEEAGGVPPLEPWDNRYAFLTESFGIEPLLARRACTQFNKLSFEERETFFAIVVQGKTMNRWVAEGHGPPDVARRLLERAMKALSLGPEPPNLDFGEEMP